MKQRSVQYNFIMNFILTSSSILFPLITFPYVSRILLPAGTGKVAFATGAVSYFTMAAMLGIPTYGIRAVARVREDPVKLKTTVCELLSINLIMGAVAYAAFFASLILVPRFAADKPLMLICSLAILLNVIGVSWFYQGMEQYTYITWVSIAFKILGVITMVLFIHSPKDDLWYGLMTVISSFGSGIVNFVLLTVSLKGIKTETLNLKQHLKPVSTFFAITAATTIYTNLDTVMLGFMKGDYEVGLYNAAVKIKTLLTALVTSLGTVLLPRLSYYMETNRKAEFSRLISRAFSFVLLFAVPVSLFAMAFSGQILDVLSGPEYLPAMGAMIVLMPAVVLIGLSNVSGIQILVPLGREKQVLYSVSAGALLDLALNLVLIPEYGAAGAAMGTLAAEILVLLWQLAALKEELKGFVSEIEWKPLLISLAISLPVLIGCFLCPFDSPLFALAVSGTLYFAAYGIGLIGSGEQTASDLLHKIKRP
ncbi:MAG: flippase [Erysipelotrichaceae bacterium]|nr:flippase [Erysipelotrichaceae bacterium]